MTPKNSKYLLSAPEGFGSVDQLNTPPADDIGGTEATAAADFSFVSEDIWHDGANVTFAYVVPDDTANLTIEIAISNGDEIRNAWSNGEWYDMTIRTDETGSYATLSFNEHHQAGDVIHFTVQLDGQNSGLSYADNLLLSDGPVDASDDGGTVDPVNDDGDAGGDEDGPIDADPGNGSDDPIDDTPGDDDAATGPQTLFGTLGDDLFACGEDVDTIVFLAGDRGENETFYNVDTGNDVISNFDVGTDTLNLYWVGDREISAEADFLDLAFYVTDLDTMLDTEVIIHGEDLIFDFGFESGSLTVEGIVDNRPFYADLLAVGAIDETPLTLPTDTGDLLT